MAKGKPTRLDFVEGDMALKFLVSPNCAGKLIGRGGDGIKQLRQELGIKFHIHNFGFPGTEMQIAVIGGQRESVDQACAFIIEKMFEDDFAMWKPNGELVVSLVLSLNTVSKIIGTKGATIRELQNQSGCHFNAEKTNVKGEQLLSVSHGDPQALVNGLTLLSPYVEEAGDSLALAQQDYYDVMPGKGSKGGAGVYAPAPMMGKGVAAAAPYAQAAPIGGKGYAAYAPAPAAGPYGKGMAPGVGKGKAVALDGKGKKGAAAVPVVDSNALAYAPESPEILDSLASIQFAIPATAISRVLGQKGVLAAEIRKMAGVKLKIDTVEQDGIVTVEGSVLGVHHAHCMVLSRVHSEY